jgi:hypothetical protein
LDLDSSVWNPSSVSGSFRLNKSLDNLCTHPCLLFHYGFAKGSLFVCCPELQQVYMYFRGSGKAAEMKREAATRTMMAALWHCSHWTKMLFLDGTERPTSILNASCFIVNLADVFIFIHNSQTKELVRLEKLNRIHF